MIAGEIDSRGLSGKVECIMNERLQHVVDTLEAWAGDQILPRDTFLGICWNLARLPWEVHNARGLVAEAALSWPERSGSLEYPVPHLKMPPQIAYESCRTESMWVGKYGAARRRLCQHIADWCRANPARAMHFLGEAL